MYEEVNPNNSPSSTQESDVTVNTVTKTCEESSSSNHNTTNTVSVTNEKITVPIELHQENEALASNNNTVYEEVTPQKILNSGTDDQEMGKKMESKTTSTTKQALACNGEGEKEPTTDVNLACEATTAL